MQGMHGFPRDRTRRTPPWKRAPFSSLANQRVFALPTRGDARWSPRVWSYATTPPTLVSPLLYGVKTGHGDNVFLAGGGFSLIDHAYASIGNLYDEDATTYGSAEYPHAFTVDWGAPKHLSRADLLHGTGYSFGTTHISAYKWEGSNDRTIWAVLSSQASADNVWTHAYIDSAVAYRYYRYTTTGMYGGLGPTSVPVYGVKLYPTDYVGAISSIEYLTAPAAGTSIVVEYVAL